jgi:hypothetical protein
MTTLPHTDPGVQPSSDDGGPWSAAALTRRALDDLRDMAEVMHHRQRHPDDILHALAERAALWHRRGAMIDDQDVLRAVRAVQPDYQPYADLQHALTQDRIRDAITAMQQEIAGRAYRDGFSDAGGLTRDEIIDLIRDVLAQDLPDALRMLQGGAR